MKRTIAQEVITYYLANLSLIRNNGFFDITCLPLWDMSDDTFRKIFLTAKTCPSCGEEVKK